MNSISLSRSPSNPISPLFLLQEKLLFSSIIVLILWSNSYISSQVLHAGQICIVFLSNVSNTVDLSMVKQKK